ncbi:MAG TPA: AmmeMemoRadiSam system protein A [Candidatus Limnocylindrales bacterium]|nr:AmmeMemoRadiSam system protein A [Candidatus Limnocylindrales bacterium]
MPFGAPPPPDLRPEAGLILLRLARAVVGAAASRRAASIDLSAVLPPDLPPCLVSPAAAFVTLHRGNELRGCVGSLDAGRALWRNVASAAVSAAHDPRLVPVTESEVPALSIDVSALGPVVPLADPTAFQPGLDGLIVERDGWRGLLLPEVATEHGWDVVDMLEGTCWKAGLPADAWRDEHTQVSAFRTARVSENGSMA